MKTHPIILLSLIAQSLCAQVQNWAFSGSYEMRIRDKGNPAQILSWESKTLDAEKLSEVSLTTVPTPEYDQQIRLSDWYGSRQNWTGTNQTVITLSNGILSTNIVIFFSNGSWETGGNCTSWQGRNIDGFPYEMECYANMAVEWKTNTGFYYQCLEHTDHTYVLGLYRTNGTASLAGLNEANLLPGHIDYLIAPEVSGRHDFKFMMTQSCRHCGAGCTLAWIRQPVPMNVRALLLNNQARIQILIPTDGRQNKWELEASSGAMNHWTRIKSGIVSLMDKFSGDPVSVEDDLPDAGSRFYRVKFSQPSRADMLAEMFKEMTKGQP